MTSTDWARLFSEIWYADWRAGFGMYYRGFVLGAIIAGLVLKLIWTHAAARTPWGRSGVIDVAMNLASSASDNIVVPFAAMLWMAAAGIPLNKFAGVDWFTPINTAGFVMVCGCLRSLVERAVLRFGFGHVVGRRAFAVLCVVNWLCVIAGIVSMGVLATLHPPQA